MTQVPTKGFLGSSTGNATFKSRLTVYMNES